MLGSATKRLRDSYIFEKSLSNVIKRKTVCQLFGALLLFLAAASVNGQSNDSNFPTSVTAPEINGTVRPRELGDSRATTYYYAFEGVQGDIFINVVTKNFVGDIDVFLRDGLRPLSKMVIFDAGANETGRLVYLRKAERLLLRVQGRTPNDESATFRIKFGGSFVAIAPTDDEGPPTIAKEAEKGEDAKPVETKPEIPVKKTPEERTTRIEPPSRSGTQASGIPTPKKEELPAKSPVPDPRRSRVPEGSTKPTPPNTGAASTPKKTSEKPPDPMASVRLMVLLRDGSVIARQMNEVSRFTVEKAVLIVVLKDGGISRFPMRDVVRVTIE